MKVGESHSNVHQCMVFIWKSTIPGAGHSLLSILKSQINDFSNNTILCWYVHRLLLTVEEGKNIPNTDNCTLDLSVKNCIVTVDASVFNIRFAMISNVNLLHVS